MMYWKHWSPIASNQSQVTTLLSYLQTYSAGLFGIAALDLVH